MLKLRAVLLSAVALLAPQSVLAKAPLAHHRIQAWNVQPRDLSTGPAAPAVIPNQFSIAPENARIRADISEWSDNVLIHSDDLLYKVDENRYKLSDLRAAKDICSVFSSNEATFRFQYPVSKASLNGVALSAADGRMGFVRLSFTEDLGATITLQVKLQLFSSDIFIVFQNPLLQCASLQTTPTIFLGDSLFTGVDNNDTVPQVSSFISNLSIQPYANSTNGSYATSGEEAYTYSNFIAASNYMTAVAAST